MQITILEPVEKKNSYLYCSQSILNEIQKFFVSQKGMYKRYLLKYFGTFTVFIDHTVIKLQKYWTTFLIYQGLI
jgi:hypothetical protein